MEKEDYYALAALIILAPHFHAFIAGLMALGFFGLCLACLSRKGLI